MKMNMTSMARKYAVLGSVVMLGALGGCASTGDLDGIKALANQASQKAESAQRSATDAASAANAASQKADQANRKADQADQKADQASQKADKALQETSQLRAELDRMFKKSMQK